MAQIILTNGVAPATPGAGTVSIYTKSSDKRLYYKDDAGTEVGPLSTGGGGGGDVTGPASATDNAVARFDGTTGKLIQNSAVTIADTTGDIVGGSYNRVTITAPATSATLTIANTKTLTVNNTLALSGTDSTTMTFPAASDTLAGLGTDQTFTGSQRGAVTTDNDLSFDMNAANNFSCTPTGTGTLTFTNITAGQSGFILLANTSGYTISLAATTKGDGNFASTISAAGTYLISYFSNGTNVYCTTTGAIA